MYANEQARTPEGKRPARTPASTRAHGGSAQAAPFALQAAAGNAAVVQMLRAAGHPWAQEQHQHNAGCGHGAEASVVQRSAAHEVLRTSGRPLDDSTRAEMESRLGADFSDVRIHTDRAAQASAAEVGARAYTSGSHVVIGDGGGDKRTLAHELTHVIQQRQGPVAGTDNGSGLRVSDPADRFERAAEANAARVMAEPVPTQRRVREAHGAGSSTPASTSVNTREAPIQRAQITEGDATVQLGNRVTSREAIVYVERDYVYKVFTSLPQGRTVAKRTREAAAAGVPVPNWTGMETTYTDGPSSVPAYVIRMKKVSGTFFQLSKPGHEKIFKRLINEITDLNRLHRLRGQLASVKEAQMTDVQGFLTNNPQDGEIFFLDIHASDGGGGSVDPLIAEADARIARLKDARTALVAERIGAAPGSA
ncbi:DUF4157 domain-containing protein [Streptomyces xanthochromogenes]|uniref:eCIS core domain-containing protein n=1 Tax=Streptomyces xanthochromogenes TaxID=67384 RepID=UPI003829621D